MIKILFQDDFESGELGKWGSLSANAQTSIKHAGDYATHIIGGVLYLNIVARNPVKIDFYWLSKVVEYNMLLLVFCKSEALYLDITPLELLLDDGSGDRPFPAHAYYNIDTWYHIILTIDHGTANLNINNTDYGTLPIQFVNDHIESLMILGSDGYIDDFIIYSTFIDTYVAYMIGAALSEKRRHPYALDAIISNRRYTGEQPVGSHPWGMHTVQPEDRPVF